MLLYDTFIMVIIIIGSKTAGGTVLEVTQTNNIEAINGSTVEITCNTNGTSGSINWYVLDHSSLNVGDNLTSRCTFLLGICLPAVVGRYTFSISGSNILASISDLDLSDENYWICAQNSDPSDVKNLKLEVKVPITDISMNTSGNVTVLEGSEQRLSCTTTYGRPAADITFIKVINGITTNLQNPGITYNQSGDQFTTGLLTYQPTINDTGATISCLANNTLTQGTVTSSNTLILTVQGQTTTSTTSKTSTMTSTTSPATTPSTTASTRSTVETINSSANISKYSQTTTVTLNGVGASQTIPVSSIGSSSTTQGQISTSSGESRIVIIAVSASMGGSLIIILVIMCVVNLIKNNRHMQPRDISTHLRQTHTQSNSTEAHHLSSYTRSKSARCELSSNVLNTNPNQLYKYNSSMYRYPLNGIDKRNWRGQHSSFPQNEHCGFTLYRGDRGYSSEHNWKHLDRGITQGGRVKLNPLYTGYSSTHFDVSRADSTAEHYGLGSQQFGLMTHSY